MSQEILQMIITGLLTFLTTGGIGSFLYIKQSKKFNINVLFEFPEELGMPVISKENTPLLDELVQLVGSIKK